MDISNTGIYYGEKITEVLFPYNQRKIEEQSDEKSILANWKNIFKFSGNIV